MIFPCAVAEKNPRRRFRPGLPRGRTRLTSAILALLFAVSTGAMCGSSAVPKRPGTFAVIETTHGHLVVELFPQSAPKTVANFVSLARKGFYRNIIFHRVIPNFMAQTGDPTGTGSGGPGYQFEDEINADSLGLDKLPFATAPQKASLMRKVQQAVFQKLRITSQAELDRRMPDVRRELARYEKRTVKEVLMEAGYSFRADIRSRKAVRGALAMANSGPNTNGSQFFINQVDTPHLDGLHTVFGQLVSSPEVLEKIIAAGNGVVKIEEVRVFEK